MGLPKKPPDRFQVMAAEVHGYVTNVSIANVQKLQFLLERLGKEDVKRLEINYTHLTGENAFDRLNPRLLRDRIRRLWLPRFKDKAEKTLELLERKNPLEPKPVQQSGGVNERMRKSAIAQAQRIKGKKLWPEAWVQPDLLAQWLFGEKVWLALCNAGPGGGIGYTEHTIGGAYTAWLFKAPDESEVSKWDTGGAETYLRQIALRIDKQLTIFSKEIGWFMAGRGTVMAGEGVLSGLKGKIRAYQASWEKLGKSTGTADYLKDKLLLPQSTFMKYLWSEKTRNELRLWRESKVE